MRLSPAKNNKKKTTMNTKHLLSVILSLYFLSLSVFAVTKPEQAVAATLDSFHQAASKADGKQYFSLLTENAVFLGTDPNERWTKNQFKQFAMPIFNRHRGWLYVVKARHITFLPNKQSAFFDEVLSNTKYGECRGSGVVQLTPNGWKIAQYNLSIPIPNNMANAVVTQIKQAKQAKQAKH
jgi:hypothetical protein